MFYYKEGINDLGIIDLSSMIFKVFWLSVGEVKGGVDMEFLR